MAEGLVLVAGLIFEVGQEILIPVIVRLELNGSSQPLDRAAKPLLAQGQHAPLKARQGRLFLIDVARRLMSEPTAVALAARSGRRRAGPDVA